MKSEYQQIKDIVNEAVERKKTESAKITKEESAARMRLEAAQMDMAAALDADDCKKYETAGLEKEKASLNLEFISKLKAANAGKVGGTPAQDTFVRRGINAEARQIRKDALLLLKDSITESVKLCDEALNKANEIENISKAWDGVMNRKYEPIAQDIILTFTSFKKAQEAQLYRYIMMGEGNL